MIKKFLPGFALASVLAVFCSGRVSAAELRSTLGTVEVKKAGAAVWSQARPKTKVNDGDVVRTGAGAQTELRFDEGHKMTLREKTTLKVITGQSPETKLDLVVGRIRTFVSKLKAQRKFEVSTPVAVASIRGTIFEMEVTENQASRLSVLEGVVSYRDLAGLGAEVQVLKGQSVVVEPGMAPRPPEPLPQDLREGLVPDREQQTASFDMKAEIQRETGLAAYKEFFQSDAAAEMKTAQYQEGKTLIDAFGKRVRLEEYILRPAANQWSFVALNTREDRFDFTRFDLYAKNALPEDMATVNLFSGTGHNSMTNWVEKTNRLTSNGSDYLREWQDGGAPINMTKTDGTKYQQVVFADWFVEAKAAGASAPVLLSHWQPHAGFSGGNPLATFVDADNNTVDDDVDLDGVLDIPSGYVNYESADAGVTVGDTRGIDAAGFSNSKRLDYFADAAVAASYKGSEGYARKAETLFNDKTWAASSSLEILSSNKISQLNTYTVPGQSAITLQVDQYYFNDDGDRLSFLQAASLTSDSIQGINYESVATSSLYGDRKLDVVISPSIFKKAGLLNN
ncbi:MAG TPA: FecR family protein [Elusimicrobiota bacterium]|nr:FecR family protein [Elusimicrobiota bacterium]